MKPFEGILLCTDLDGTLLNSRHTVSPENLAAIEYFKAGGGYFTFMTGRMPFFASDIYEAVQPNAPFGCINGGGVFDHRTGHYVWTQPADPSVMELVACVDRELPTVGIQVNTFDGIYFCKESPAMVYFRDVTGAENVVRPYREITEPVAKILFGSHEEEEIQQLAALLQAHPLAERFDFIRSEKSLYEILPKGVSKGTMLERVAEHLGVPLAKTVALGDYNNDIAMLKTAKLGVAVSNACADAKAAADHITVSNDEHAVAQVITDLECGRLSV